MQLRSKVRKVIETYSFTSATWSYPFLEPERHRQLIFSVLGALTDQTVIIELKNYLPITGVLKSVDQSIPSSSCLSPSTTRVAFRITVRCKTIDRFFRKRGSFSLRDMKTKILSAELGRQSTELISAAGHRQSPHPRQALAIPVSPPHDAPRLGSQYGPLVHTSGSNSGGVREGVGGT